MPTLRVSNLKFFDVLDPLPLQNTGWEVKVYMRNNPNTLVAIVPRWTYLSASKPLSDIGSGEIHILRDDRIFKDALPFGVVSEILEDETIWKFYWNGIHRFSMFCEDVDKTHVDDSERAVVKITGRTTGKALEHSTVLPPYFPAFTEPDHTYSGVSVMHAWRVLYDEAVARGALPVFFTCTLQPFADSTGTAYEDVSTFTVPPGGNLLELIRRWSEIASVDWQVTKDNVVEARKEFGNHRENQIVFFVSGSVQKLGEQKTRRDIRNHIYVEGGGTVTQAVDGSSETKWGRRETWITAGEADDAATAGTFGASTLQTLKNERKQITAKVLPDTPGRVVFVDYDIGDWVTIEFDELDSAGVPKREVVKILSISWTVDENGKMDLELTLSTRLQESLIRMQQALLRMTSGGSLAGASSSASTPISTGSVISASNLDDLNDVSAPTPAEGDFLKRSGTNWINSPAPTLDDLTGVNLTGITDGQSIAWNVAAGEFRPYSPAGVGKIVKDKVWIKGSAAGAFDDEFDDGIIDPAWVRVDKSGNSTPLIWTEGADVMSLKHEGADGSAEFHGLMKAMTGLTPPVTIECAIRIMGPYASNYVMSGIGFSNSIVWGSGVMLSNHGYSNSGNGSGLYMTNYYNPGWAGSVTFGTAYGQAQFVGAIMYLRMRWDAANTWSAWISGDGVSWINVLSGAAYTMTPTYFGLIHSHYSGNFLKSISSFEYFRVS